MRLDKFAREMARALGQRGHQKRSLLVPSFKMGRELRVESPLEALTVHALDIHPWVKSIHPQPFTLRLDLLQVFATKSQALAAAPRVPPKADREQPDDVYVYTPDFLVPTTRHPELVLESKTMKQLALLPAGTVEQWRSALAAVGYRFAVVTDDDLDALGLKYNLVCIRDAMRQVHLQGAGVLEPLMQIVQSWQGPLCVEALQQLIAPHVILMGIATGVLGCDLRAGVLAPSTVLWPAAGDLSHLQVLPLEIA